MTNTSFDSHTQIPESDSQFCAMSRVAWLTPGLIGKRATDIVFSLVVIILGAPLAFLIALTIKLDSPGPVIFTQKRFGFVPCM